MNADHARKLRETGWLLQESLGFGNACSYGSGQREREAFRAHHRALARGLDCWDRVLREQRVSDQALRDRVAQLVNGLEAPESVYDVGLISTFMNGAIDARLGDDGARGSTSVNWRPAMTSENPVWGVVSAGDERWIILPPAEGESQEDWHQRDLAARKPVEEILKAVQTMPMDAAVAARQQVREFKDAELPELNDDLARVAEIDPPRRRKRCPTCRGVRASK